MLNVTLKPHRTSLRAGTAEPQKVYAMLRLIPQQDVAAARPPLALALVIDTSGSMREFADQERAEQEAQSRGVHGSRQSADGANYQAVDLKLPTKLDQAIEAAHRLIDDDRLQPGDQVTIVRFDDNATTVLPLTPLSSRDGAHQAIDSLHKF